MTVGVPAVAVLSRLDMKGGNKFCPRSGAELGEETHHDEHGIPFRAPEDDVDEAHYGAGPVGELSCGELVSSRIALANYFRRCHQLARGPDDQLYRAMALALRRLKSGDSDDWDVWIWFALEERLHRKGFDVDWMDQFAEARCLRCGSVMKWERTPRGVQGKCAVNCSDDNDYREPEIRERIRTIYDSAFATDGLTNGIRTLQTV